MKTAKTKSKSLALQHSIVCAILMVSAALTAAAEQAAPPAKRAPIKPIRKIYIMTDLEGVAGVRDSATWCLPDGKFYDEARKLLTLEVNAAI